jgi:hypothetical protein
MALATIIALTSTSLTIVFHFWSILKLKSLMPSSEDHNHFFRSFIILEGIFFVHLCEIFLFSLSFYLATEILSIGGFSENFTFSPLNYFYYSISTYSTLGLSNFYPDGALKIISGFASLTGFIMITWSATFFFSIVHKADKG